MKTITKAGMTILMTLLLVQPGLAKKGDYQVAPVEKGGSLSGAVSFKGKVPGPIMEDLTKGKNAEFCATHPDTRNGHIRPRHKVVVTDGKLRDVVVFIENISKGKDWPQEPTRFEFQKCDIFPKVTVVRKTPRGVKEGLVKITNHDPDVLHNPHGYSKVGARVKTLFNKPLPNKGDVADVTNKLKRFKMKKDKHFFLQCDQHNFMEADARIIWNPYYAVTGKEGKFHIDQIPAGTYRVTAWHPYAGEVTQEITVKGGQTTPLNFQMNIK